MRIELAAAAIAALLTAVAAGSEGSPSVGPIRLLSSDRGYAVSGTTLYSLDGGRWRDITPRGLRTYGIEDVAFSDRRHGWIAAAAPGARCYTNSPVAYYRTIDAGRSWSSIGFSAGSCGRGPARLSFVDSTHGWRLAVSGYTNVDGGWLDRTTDGGRNWTQIAKAQPGRLPCVGPFGFSTPTVGWLTCPYRGGLFVTRDAGHRWRRVALSAASPRTFGVPRIFGRRAVLVSIAGGETARSAAFAVSGDGGRSWSFAAERAIGPCPGAGFRNYELFEPVGIVSPRVWWLVSGRRRIRVETTNDGGRHWRTVEARGLPVGPSACPVIGVSAVNDRVAWALLDLGLRTAAYETRDGGRTWHAVRPGG